MGIALHPTETNEKIALLFKSLKLRCRKQRPGKETATLLTSDYKGSQQMDFDQCGDSITRGNELVSYQ